VPEDPDGIVSGGEGAGGESLAFLGLTPDAAVGLRRKSLPPTGVRRDVVTSAGANAGAGPPPRWSECTGSLFLPLKWEYYLSGFFVKIM